jgi:hypothetical protein
MVMTVNTTIKRKYLRMKKKTGVDMHLTYLILAYIALHVSTYNLGHHHALLYDL